MSNTDQLVRTSNKEIKKRKKRSPFKIVLQAVMTLVAAAFMVPVFIIFNYSFKTKKELYLGNAFALPQSFNLDNYKTAYKKLNLGTTFFNTLFYTVVSVLILALLCSVTAWAIARCKRKFFKFAYVYFIIGYLIPYQALFLPIYIVGNRLGLTNTRFGIIFMYIAVGMSFGIFLMNSFMSTVPLELEEAARLDGCSVLQTYFYVVFPLLKPAMATLIIMQSFLVWNDYLLASLFASSKSLKTLTVAMQQLFSTQSNDYNTAMAAVVISVLPISRLFLSLQKYFIKGMTAGSVKS